MKKRFVVVTLVGVSGMLLWWGDSWGQSAKPPGNKKPSGPRPGQSTPTTEIPVGTVMVPDGGYVRALYPRPQSEITRIMDELRDVEEDAKKAELTKQLEAAVAQHFDADMTAREEELTKLEERLNKLRAQLERRRKAKTEIIELQLKVLVNEADGLGFSGASSFNFGRIQTNEGNWFTPTSGALFQGSFPAAPARPMQHP